MAALAWLTVIPLPTVTGMSSPATSTPASTHSPNIFKKTPLRTPAPIIKRPREQTNGSSARSGEHLGKTRRGVPPGASSAGGWFDLPRLIR